MNPTDNVGFTLMARSRLRNECYIVETSSLSSPSTSRKNDAGNFKIIIIIIIIIIIT